MVIQEKIISLIERALLQNGIAKELAAVTLDHPTEQKFGDYSTNIALLLAAKLGQKPRDIAEKLAETMRADIAAAKHSSLIEKIEMAGAGFINFFLAEHFFTSSVAEILEKGDSFGRNATLAKEKIIIEYTDPNAFKPLHIGHLMSNAIGESLSRLLEFQGAELRRATYGSDVGLNVAMAVWGMQKLAAEKYAGVSAKEQVQELHKLPLSEKIAFIGKAYVFGVKAADDDAATKEEIQQLNRNIYTHADPVINEFYVFGKQASIEHFAEIYALLGSRFDHQIFESDIAAFGEEIVKNALERGIFEKSEGAIIYPGDKKGLHNRVFITSHGIPTYEAKELGLTKKKFELHDFDTSIVITANEQNDYFKVVMAALAEIYPEIAKRTKHIGHGLMRFAEGKMSSRTGNVITGEALLSELATKAIERMDEKDQKIANHIAVAALKYSVLKQSIGKDVIFDPEQSISFEGDSGPYIQYSYVRTQALLAKAKKEGIKPAFGELPASAMPITHFLYRFPEIVERAATEYAPQYLATYLATLASDFNSWYAAEKIVDAQDAPASAAKLALVIAIGHVLKTGLWLLGITAPERM